MHCTKCGAEILDGAKFCNSCGASVDGAIPVGKATATSAQPKKTMSKGVKVGCGIVAAIIGLFILIGVFSGGGSDDTNQATIELCINKGKVIVTTEDRTHRCKTRGVSGNSVFSERSFGATL